jgi:hypothetical protein
MGPAKEIPKPAMDGEGDPYQKVDDLKPLE